MKKNSLRIRGAKIHNLKNISLDIPKNSLVVFTGVSGSGKSSLAFDTIYAEGQRRYVESLSAYARQFLGVMDKPEVDAIDGISPAIAIDQKSISRNPRSTVGTITEIYDYLRLLFARVGTPHCPKGHGPISRQTPQQIRGQLLKHEGEFYILAPLVRGKKGEHRAILEQVEDGGFLRVRVDGHFYTLEDIDAMELDPKKKHSIDVVVDRMTFHKKEKVDTIRLSDSIETALRIGKGLILAARTNGEEELAFSEHFACATCGFSAAEIEPRTFSFNSPYGACPPCSGLGSQMEADPALIIPNKRLSLEEGAIKPWMSASHRLGRQGWYWYILRGMADKYNFSLSKPVKDLPKAVFDIILSGDEEFEGVIPNLERRYKETDSEWTRAEIQKYMNIRVCPACEGKRLKEEALAVRLQNYTIDDVVNMNVGDAHTYFSEESILLEKTRRSVMLMQKQNSCSLLYL